MFARLLPILGITFIDILGFSILIPILPYYVLHFGAPDWQVGALFATFAFCQFIGGPIWGNVSDRIGRKAVLIISQIGATIGWAMLAFAPTLFWVFVARVIEGFSGGNISVTQAYVADRVEPEQRPRAFAYVGAAFSAGLVFGPAAGGLLLEHFGYATPFLLAAGLQVVTLLLTIFFLPETVAAHSKKQETATFRDILRYFREPRIAPTLAQKLAYSLGLYAWFAAFALFLKAVLHFGPTSTSYAFSAFGVISVVMQLFAVGRIVGGATTGLGVRRASNLGFFLGCLFFVIVPFVSSFTALMLTMLLFSATLALSNATLPELLTAAVPEHVRGTVLGVGSSLESISGSIMPIVSTAILAVYGPSWAGALSAFFVFIALGIGLVMQRRERGNPPAGEASASS
ncbi:MAG: MFS transporter [Candidatus Eremiobacteraeota bacterium]|nr:MFS transporter [Candidatus Eremiobacteraeota bacterium]